MKIGLIAEEKLKDILEDVQVMRSLEDIEDSMDAVVVDGKYISVNELLNTFDSYRKSIKTFYILSKDANSIKKSLLENKGITIIPSSYTHQEIAVKVLNALNTKEEVKENVIVFFGADNKVGTSMIAQSVAEKLSSSSDDIKVLFAILDGTPGMDYIKILDWKQSMDTIRVKIMNHMLSDKELMDICLKIKNLYVLQGTQSFFNRRYYHPEHIESLLQQLSEIFDVVIVDAGNNIELGMTIGALNSSIHKFLICTQQMTCENHFKSIYSQILSPLNLNEFFLVINKYISNSQLPEPNQLAEVYKAPYICSIPYSEYGIQAEMEKCTLHHYKEPGHVEAIMEIVSLIQDSLGFEKLEQKQNILFLSKVFPFRK